MNSIEVQEVMSPTPWKPELGRSALTLKPTCLLTVAAKSKTLAFRFAWLYIFHFRDMNKLALFTLLYAH